MWKLLVIDDEPERTEQIADWFSSIDFEVIRAHSGKEGLAKARGEQPDVILLDIVMPEMDGHEVLLRLKRDPSTARLPVVICSFRADELDSLKDLMRTGLREGADYVVAKKWGLAALEEVVRKLLATETPGPSIKVGASELKLGEECIEVWTEGQPRKLTRLEARVLAYLNDHRGQPCGVKEIVDAVWEDAADVAGDEGRARRIIERLREKIEPDRAHPIFIVTVPGHGYKLVDSGE